MCLTSALRRLLAVLTLVPAIIQRPLAPNAVHVSIAQIRNSNHRPSGVACVQAEINELEDVIGALADYGGPDSSSPVRATGGRQDLDGEAITVMVAEREKRVAWVRHQLCVWVPPYSL